MCAQVALERPVSWGVHHRSGFRHSTPKVCKFWRQGRCTRRPCPFLHYDPYAAPGPTKSAHSEGLVWRNPNSKPTSGNAVGRATEEEDQSVRAHVDKRPRIPIASPSADQKPASAQETKADRKAEDRSVRAHVVERPHIPVASPSADQKPSSAASAQETKADRKGEDRSVRAHVAERPHIPVASPSADQKPASAASAQGTKADRNGEEQSMEISHGHSEHQSIEAPCVDLRYICRGFLKGTCSHGDKCQNLHMNIFGDHATFVTSLVGHQKAVTGITLPSGSSKLWTGSNDGSIKVWDCVTGECMAEFVLGGEVGCLYSMGSWVFAGIPNTVKAWNTQTMTEQSLSGPVGQVYALDVGKDMTLFAGAQDGSISVWKLDSELKGYEHAASLTGHRLAVVSIVFGAGKLYSGSMDHDIKIWDLEKLECVQTLTGHTSVVTSVLCWDQFLISCSLDRTIKVWALTESYQVEEVYTHKVEHGLIKLSGIEDDQRRPLLICSCNDDTVRFYDLPSFGERGRIFVKEEVRAINIGPDKLFFIGDGGGEVKVWRLLPNEKAPAS